MFSLHARRPVSRSSAIGQVHTRPGSALSRSFFGVHSFKYIHPIASHLGETKSLIHAAPIRCRLQPARIAQAFPKSVRDGLIGDLRQYPAISALLDDLTARSGRN